MRVHGRTHASGCFSLFILVYLFAYLSAKLSLFSLSCMCVRACLH